MEKIKMPEYAKIKVYWDDKPENYSRQSKLKVQNYFSTKYGVNKKNIDVVYRPVKVGVNGEVIEITGAGIDNILDKNYQVELMKEWYKREGKTIDFKKLMKLDKIINESIEGQFENKNNKSWGLKWLYIDNFLSFGENNFISFSPLNGLNIVNSIPSNQGGKTTFSVDAIKFLLFGKTTKTDKNEQIFNTYTDKDELTVRGMLIIEGDEMIIERKLSRKAKRNGGWTITNKVHYYEILPDGERKLLDDEDAKKTSEVIKNNIGNESDFDVTILATARNLEDLIDASPTESGRLLTKFIGLEIIENKEIIVKEMFSKFNKSKKSNHYDVDTLIKENETSTEIVKVNEESLIEYQNKLLLIESKITKLNDKREKLLSQKTNVDVEITQLNPESIERKIEEVTIKGVEMNEKIDLLNVEIEKLKNVTYDEYINHQLEKDSRDLTIEIGGLKNSLISIGKVIANLKDSEVCQTCKRALDDVNNADLIESNENESNAIQKSIDELGIKLIEINDELSKIKVNKEIVDKRNRLELERDKAEVEIISLRNTIKSKRSDLKKYKSNEEGIKNNIKIDSDISAVKTNIIIEETSRATYNRNLLTIELNNENLLKKVKENLNLIEILNKEGEVEKVYKVYIEMIGKKGISKLILRSVLPIINSELYRLLDDVCDFEVELILTDKNDVEFNIIKSDIIKPLKSGSGLERTISSLALRCVLGKISHLPTPNFITFDEVLGKVSDINIELLKPMFEKIKDMFDIVFFISHNDIVKDWSDSLITVIKENDISRFTK